MRKIWNWIVALISKVPYDKLLHLLAGLILAAFAAIVCGARWPIAVAAFAGIAKEAFDYATTKEVDWLDAVATLAGGLIIQIFVWL